MIAVQKGSTVKFYYSAQRGDIFGIGLPEGSGLSTLQDLEGQDDRRDEFCEWRNDLCHRAFSSEAGLTEQDYTLAEIGVGARAAAALKSNQVQALSMYDEGCAAGASGLPISR